MSCKSINPYELLGLTIDSTKKECKKKYYELALLCHPDKGGSQNDMIIIHNAYKYVMEQLEFQENVITHDDIEKDFKKYFNKNIKKPPSFYEIWSGTDEAKNLRKFNQNWEKQNTNNEHLIGGYGKFMISCSIDTVTSRYIDEYLREVKQLCSDTIKLINEYIYGISSVFNNEIVEYKEPMAMNDKSYCTIKDENGNVKITDFTRYDLSFGGADYMKAHTNKECKDLPSLLPYVPLDESYQKLMLEREKMDKQLENVERKISVDLIGYGTDRRDNNEYGHVIVENIE